MMLEAIKNFPGQFTWQPSVKNADSELGCNRFIVSGMGGSHLSGDILKIWKPEIAIVVHEDYGLPEMPEETLREYLFIASSYSGNTQEVIDGFDRAGERGLKRAVVAAGGKLIERAAAEKVPYVLMPEAGIQPRMALGYSVLALLKLMGQQEAIVQVRKLAEAFDVEALRAEGKSVAKKLEGFVPIVYTSRRNSAIGYIWKIKFNETSKIPAFTNVFPELNHNEMTGFDAASSTADLSGRFFILALRDADDDGRVKKRMEITGRMLEQRGLKVEFLDLAGATIIEKIFFSLLIADWTAYYLSETYGTEPDAVPMVEELKRLL